MIYLKKKNEDKNSAYDINGKYLHLYYIIKFEEFTLHTFFLETLEIFDIWQDSQPLRKLNDKHVLIHQFKNLKCT